MPSSAARSAASTRPSTPPHSGGTGHRSPNEVTSLLPPSQSPTAVGSSTGSTSFNKSHSRKASVGGRSVSGRSVAGSVRGYGATTKPAGPGPVDQPPRVSKLGQRVSASASRHSWTSVCESGDKGRRARGRGSGCATEPSRCPPISQRGHGSPWASNEMPC